MSIFIWFLRYVVIFLRACIILLDHCIAVDFLILNTKERYINDVPVYL